MQTLQFKTNIKGSAFKVYETMLGLRDKATYEYWTAMFNPTSSFEGNWSNGSKILFIGLDENGKRGGMVSKILENTPGKHVVIQHKGFVDGDQEILTGEHVEKWAGGREIYSFEEHNGMTTVTVDLDAFDEFIDYFNERYPLALEKLKEICEG
jgi:hypothetical protein